MSSPTGFVIQTERTIIVSTPTEALERSHELDEFEIDVDVDGAPTPIRVPGAWPGADLEGLPDLLELRQAGRPEPWTGMVIDRDGLEAVGQVGCTATPDADGTVEVRYATIQERRAQGFATEAGGAFVDWLLEQPGVRSVIAECLVTNVATVRVLEKTGFDLLEEREDESGRLLRWVKRRA